MLKNKVLRGRIAISTRCVVRGQGSNNKLGSLRKTARKGLLVEDSPPIILKPLQERKRHAISFDEAKREVRSRKRSPEERVGAVP